MSYTNKTLTFESDKIYYTDTSFGGDFEVMMDWEDPLMSASAAYVCEGGGDILEIGFGVGISAGYIQSHSISSHTIIENHPQIIPLAQEWAKDKPNVTIISGSWHDVYKANKLSTYDGLFFDIWNLGPHHIPFSASLSYLMKSGGNATWWNNTQDNVPNQYGIPDTEYEVFDVSCKPEDEEFKNSYYPMSKYYLPKKQF